MKRAREGVAVQLSDVWHSAMIDFECANSRVLWIKFEFSRVKVCVVELVKKGRDSGMTWTGLWIE